jgi:hypothetical protein
MKDFHGLETALNRSNDLTSGTFLMISSWISKGMLSHILKFLIRVSDKCLEC